MTLEMIEVASASSSASEAAPKLSTMSWVPSSTESPLPSWATQAGWPRILMLSTVTPLATGTPETLKAAWVTGEPRMILSTPTPRLLG